MTMTKRSDNIIAAMIITIITTIIAAIIIAIINVMGLL